MSEIEDLQRRILSAFQRISSGMETLTADAGPDLAAALEEEQLANAQLGERLAALKEDNAAKIQALRQEIASQAQALGSLDSDIQKLRITNRQLRDSNAALRAANAEGVGNPELINAALQADLDAMIADRAAEMSEVAAILAQLKPLLGKAADAMPEGASGVPNAAAGGSADASAHAQMKDN
ncbi:MAG: hypothetical protein ACWA5A_02685 [Marinibacterium sp.]